MKPWMHHAVMTVVLIVGLTIRPVSGQQETVNLQLKLARGETLYFSDSGAFQLSLEAQGSRANVDVRYDARQAIRVLDVDPDGLMTVEFVLENFRLTTGRETEESIDSPWTGKVRPDGRVAETLVGPPEVEDFPYALPGRPVRVGESWSRRASLAQLGFSGQGTGSYTLAGVDRVSDGRVARVRFSIEVNVTGSGAGVLPAGAQGRVRGTLRTVGEFLWSLDRGRMVRSSSELTGNVESEVTVQGQTAQARVTMSGTARQDGVAAESVMPATVAPDLLIAPGKGVGAFALTLTVPELTNRLGSPEPGPTGAGFVSASLHWPNGLGGFLDSSDQTKLVGLDVADRRYRTDKGIGFGSSQGAVLMAYGMSPVRVEMSIPRLGGVRVLIYDDQGIAFAITSDAAHANAGPGHAPIGAVDWITVFPPGGAGKVYQLP